MYSFSVKSLNLLNHPKLNPSLRMLFIEAIKDAPLDFTVLETVRTKEKQLENIKNKVSQIIKSKHIPEYNASGYCEAVDVAPYPINWNDKERFRKLAAHIMKKAQLFNIPLTWGGNWKTLVDMPHFELKR